MSENFDTASAAQAHADTQAPTPVVLTKEEKLAKITKEIARLQAKYDDILNDRVTVKAKKEIVLPNAGDEVLFTYGRRTATTEPVQKVGVVVAVKPASEKDGKKLPAQIKVQVGEGFDTEFVTIYPAQIVTA